MAFYVLGLLLLRSPGRGQESIASCTGKDGKDVRNYISSSLKKLHGQNKHLATQFWVDFHLNFDSRAKVCEALIEPSDDEDAREDLFAAL